MNGKRFALIALLGTVILGSVGAAPAAGFATVPLPRFAEDAAWASDGSAIAVTGHGEIDLEGTDGGVVRRLRGPGIDYFGFPCEPCNLGWSADSGQVLFVSGKGIEGDESVGMIGADGGGLRVQSLGVPVGAAAWGPAGWPLVFIPNERTRTAGGHRVGPNPDLWRLDGLGQKPRKILAQKGEEEAPVVSPDGERVLYLRDYRRSSTLWSIGIDGSKPRRLTGNLLGPSGAAWSPNGSQIAVATTSPKRGDRRQHIYVLPAAGGRLRQVVSEEVQGDPPAWTPDGRWITFANYAGEIRLVRPDGTGVHTVAMLPGEEIRNLRWSPDGRHLAYSAYTRRESD